MHAIVDGPGKAILQTFLDPETDLKLFHLVLQLLPRSKAQFEESQRKPAEAEVDVD